MFTLFGSAQKNSQTTQQGALTLIDGINLRISGPTNTETLSQFLLKHPELTEIKLYNSGNFELPESIAKCKRLKTLSSSRSGAIKNIQILAQCENFQNLQITECEDKASINKISSCNNIVSLNLIELSTTPSLLGFTKLEKLHISSNKLETLPPLSECTELKDLFIFNCPNLKTLPPLSGCTKLKQVNLSGCDNLQLTDESINELKNLELNDCYVFYPKHLKHLNIPRDIEISSKPEPINMNPNTNPGSNPLLQTEVTTHKLAPINNSRSTT